MADEIKDLDTEETSAVADETTAIPDATGDAGQQSLDLPAAEGEDAPKPEDAAGEHSLAGASDSEATDEANPTPEAPVDLEDHGTSEALTLAAGELNDAPAGDSAPAGVEEAAPEAPSTPEATPPEADAPVPNDSASDAAAPAEAAPEEAPAISTSTGIGGDKASEVTPPDAPKLDAAPAPSPAPSSPGLFDHGTPINIPDMSIATEEGYPVAQEGAPAVHPCHFGEMVGDGVGDDAGKVVDGPKYPAPLDVVTVSGDEAKEDKGSEGEEAAPAPAAPDAGSQAPAVPPHVEGKLEKLADKLSGLEAKVDQLLHELLD